MTEITQEKLEELARKKKNEYQRNWYKEKKSQGENKAREYNQRHWKKKALEEMIEGAPTSAK